MSAVYTRSVVGLQPAVTQKDTCVRTRAHLCAGGAFRKREQVALDAGIDRNHYQVIESGRSDRRSNNPLNPQLFTLVKIANALEWSAIDLLAEPLAYYQAASAGNTSTAVPTLPARRQLPR